MTNKTYDILKYIALIVLPALAVFYSTISNIPPGVLGEDKVLIN